MIDLEHRRRVARRFALAVIAIFAIALIWAGFSDLANPPDYALRSEMIWALERAFVAVALVTAPGLVIVRLLAGDFPTGLTTAGIEWAGDRGYVTQAVQALEATIEDHQRQLDELQQ
jgi:hypothetical protein